MPGGARAVQIDRDSARIGLRYPVECGLVGDAAPTLRALLALLRPNEDRRFVEAAQKSMREWRQSLKEQGERRETPMKPQVVGYELNKLLASDAIVTTDSGTNTSWSARYLDMREDMMFAVSGNLATMACGLPYAMAAAAAFPDRQVVAFVGDGGLTMLMGELATCAKYALNVKVVSRITASVRLNGNRSPSLAIRSSGATYIPSISPRWRAPAASPAMP
jgi:pyruvate dehydrogenase (quinone)/pyruvate oxidase